LQDPADPPVAASAALPRPHAPGRALAERFFNKPRRFERVATRYERTACACLSTVRLVAVLI
jgi:hypothetical protein